MVSTLKGLDNLVKKLDRLQQAHSDMSPLMFEIATYMGRSAAQNIRTQQSPEGTPFVPLSPTTLLSRRGGKGKALNSTGRLLDSILSNTKSTSTSASVGTNLPYARLQFQGGTITPKRGKYLTVPLTTQAAASASVGRFFAQNPTARWLFSDGRPFGIGIDSNGIPKLHWILVDSIRVPARPYLGWGPLQRAAVNKIIDRYFKRAAGGTS